MDHTLYINLSDRPDRKEQVEHELTQLNATFTRIEAVPHQKGSVGCTLSHIKCIELAKENNWPHVCVCEDDIMFTNPTLFKTKLALFLKSDITWDVLLLGANLAPPYTNATPFCMKVYNAQTTTGYIVKEHYYDTLLENFYASLNKSPIDIYWKKLQKDQWYILMPLTVVQRPSYSNIENRVVNYTNAMLNTKTRS